MCGLCAKDIQPYIAKPVLYEEVFFNSAMRGKAEQYISKNTIMRTIFYFKTKSEKDCDYFLNDNPHKEFLIIEDFLYELNGNIRKSFTDKDGIERELVVQGVFDEFSQEHKITRRIILYNYYLSE